MAVRQVHPVRVKLAGQEELVQLVVVVVVVVAIVVVVVVVEIQMVQEVMAVAEAVVPLSIAQVIFPLHRQLQQVVTPVLEAL
jgi:hypothetical protein